MFFISFLIIAAYFIDGKQLRMPQSCHGFYAIYVILFKLLKKFIYLHVRSFLFDDSHNEILTHSTFSNLFHFSRLYWLSFLSKVHTDTLQILIKSIKCTHSFYRFLINFIALFVPNFNSFGIYIHKCSVSLFVHMESTCLIGQPYNVRVFISMQQCIFLGKVCVCPIFRW